MLGVVLRGSWRLLQHGRAAVRTLDVFHNEECCHNEGCFHEGCCHNEEYGQNEEGGHNEGHGLVRLEPMPSLQSQLVRSVPRNVSPRLHDVAYHLQMADDSVYRRQPTTGLEADCTGTPAGQSASAYSMASEHQ